MTWQSFRCPVCGEQLEYGKCPLGHQQEVGYHTCHACGLETLCGGHGPCVACHAYPVGWNEADDHAYLHSKEGCL